jgi:NADP-dependent 3-hydroxy acid dehydrogenase YdfG
MPTNQDIPVVFITGATSGIGRATAEVFARNGYRLILNGRRRERLDEIAHHLKTTYGADVLSLPFDVRHYEEVESAFNSIPDPFRNIDVLVNNAGLAKGLSPIHEGRLDHWETMIDTNIKGVLYLTRMVSPGMVERRKGHIVNISSSAGKEVYPNGNVYCATKFAVEALTKGFRSDLYRYNVRVSQVSPGHVEETEFAITRFDGDAERARIYDDFRPLKSSDVADAIWFMVSRPEYVNIQDMQMFGTQQASSMLIDRSGR